MTITVASAFFRGCPPRPALHPPDAFSIHTAFHTSIQRGGGGASRDRSDPVQWYLLSSGVCSHPTRLKTPLKALIGSGGTVMRRP